MKISKLENNAMVALKEKKFELAKNIYSLILDIDPKHFTANTNLGFISIQSDLLIEGLDYFKNAYVFHPKKVESSINYIRCLMICERVEEASEIIKNVKYNVSIDNYIDQYKALIYHKGDLSICSNKRKLISLFVSGKHQELVDLSKSFEIELIDDPSFNYLLGASLMRLGLLSDAIERLEHSIELEPNLVDAYRLLVNLIDQNEYKDKFYKYKRKYLINKSKNIQTKANISNVIDLHLDKLKTQDGIHSFFDNSVAASIQGVNDENTDYCKLFESLDNNKNKRFISYEDRCNFTKNQRQITGLPFLLNQGTHSLIKWKEFSLYKTCNDLILYWMILNEVKPEIIVELGSGDGGSAVWMADISHALGFETHIYSYDIKKPDLDYKGITFLEFDLNQLGIVDDLPGYERFPGKRKLVIEDAHVNIWNLLNTVNRYLIDGDYLIIEDSNKEKHKDISKFMKSKSKNYKIDQFYLDFFGFNMTCSLDSIFKVFR